MYVYIHTHIEAVPLAVAAPAICLEEGPGAVLVPVLPASCFMMSVIINGNNNNDNSGSSSSSECGGS